MKPSLQTAHAPIGLPLRCARGACAPLPLVPFIAPGRVGERGEAERRDPECRPRDPRAARWTSGGGREEGCDVDGRCQVGTVSIMHGAQALARPGTLL